MRVPLSWLGEFVDLEPGTTPEAVHAALVSVGLEEEEIHRFELTGPIVVGEVLEFVGEPQTNGKIINWCQVRVAPGDETAADGGPAVHGIVCGAHNFVVGDKVVVTLPGAVLPGPFPIAPRKTYGHVSDGMIASARELGLGDEHDGILLLKNLGLDDAPVGTDAIALLGLDDTAVEVNVTPDRGYAFSIRGIAREYSHATGAAFRDPALATVTAVSTIDFPVTLADASPIRGRVGASVFVTRAVRGVDPSRPTPAWMITRLALAGMRSISLVVDVTNYVMLELGQPLHGYDLDALAGGILVRRAEPGEKLTTLDGVVRALHSEDLLITDESGAIGLAGVMGGRSTEIGASTTNVLIEAANFDPVSIARSARRHKLPSEASRRFERGVDPQVAAVAAARVVQLLVDLAGGTADGLGSALDSSVPPVAIELPRDFISGLIGRTYSDDEERSALAEIGGLLVETPTGLSVTPPTWRPDLTDKWTLAEEVARIVGYDSIPSVLPVAPPGRGLTLVQRLRRTVAQTLAATGHTEVLAYPFVSEADNRLFAPLATTTDAAGAAAGIPAVAEVPQIRVANPLDGEAPFLRTSILPGLLRIAHRNRSRGITDLAVFEQGLVFRPVAGIRYGSLVVPAGATRPSTALEAELNAGIPPQPYSVAVALTGNTVRHQPGRAPIAAGWQDALAAVQQVALATGVPILVRQGVHPAMHPGRTAELFVATADGELSVGFAGELLPAVATGFDLPAVVAVAEITLSDVFAQAGSELHAAPIKTMPAATQDLSLVVSATVPAAEVLAAVAEGAGALLDHIELVDDYRGTGIEPGRKSLTFALRFRAPDRTLTAAEASDAKLAGVAVAAARFDATLRE
ncbi:phenylalanine--tRNA ligase subunit beta [Cryobacterium sp. MDB1-18-2]|uniref:phenylalanine--tRNA ligase subunit beta n=2 Tax=Cryobacterium TaxID=69578 RepID=UPI00106B9BA4|nr:MULTISPECIES: phenylalanine--tRNA ligase subunit beta [unclassified Cryobacterium]MDY7527207.1 phenylalanine--tRNA ligase subunit beta [Cryobacterium sp. 10C2]MEB0004318.1 phenylalanine--tRNA ligase subunit beta [Cryobacterium sp. RTC2.1]MEB0200296.1 phenylalanine--tRNA ligase subunit beta [Cryobacterium sp. 5I3]MEB0286573.1 phenylalanine--tRNA ligase subunit beta [Cryobacterium sp. 10S3]TFC27114.1 phenylalanine--tRNA ligase subunit beta [Cryobacterium sp. MDB1-18-2]